MNLPFVIWMLGWPLVAGVVRHVLYPESGGSYSRNGMTQTVKILGVMAAVAVWVLVGALVYER